MKSLDITVPLDSPGILVPHLTNNKYDSYKITKIKGALTNVIYKLSIYLDGGCQNYLVRIYGSKMTSLVNREDELKNIKIVPKEVGFVKILLPFNNGRVESFLDGFKSLSQSEMVNVRYAKVIAKNFAILHFKSVPLEGEDINIYDHGFVWEKIQNWISIIESPMGQDWLIKNKRSNVHNVLLSKDWNTFKHIITKYKNWLLNDYTGSSHSLLFCHNDTQQGNILVEESTRDDDEPNIKFIDYEYSGPNFIDFDLSNYLTECMHDYEVDSNEAYKCIGSKYPSKKHIFEFVDSYLMTKSNLGVSPNKEEIKKLYNNIIKWRAATQLFWALWAILQSGDLTSLKNDKENTNPYDEYDVETLSSSDDKSTRDGVVADDSDDDDDDDEPFNYLGFCKDKLSFFWGDLIKFGIASKDNCIIEKIQYLDTELY